MKPKVDKEKCIGCGTCVGICPEVFFLEANSKAEVKSDVDFDKYKEQITEAINSCPTEAIS